MLLGRRWRQTRRGIGRQSTGRAASAEETLASDLAALAWLAEELLPRAGELSGTAEGRALMAAVAKALATASGSSVPNAAQVSMKLKSLRDALWA